MQSIKSSILRHIRLQPSLRKQSLTCLTNIQSKYRPQMCTLAGNSDGQIMDRVISLVRSFNKTDAVKVTETTSFQKDLCLDSLERVELVMALEQEFSIEIPEEEADKLACCSDVAKYISAVSKRSTAEKS